MAQTKQELLDRALELGLDVDEENTKDDIQAALDNYDAENSTAGEDDRYFKSAISGLTVPFPALDNEDRSELEKSVRFTPYLYKDEAKGEDYKLGLLATDEPDIIEVLEDDINVEEIDEKEYQELVEAGKKVGV